jgi:uncharacterized repeat protein (TIGR03803 family)
MRSHLLPNLAALIVLGFAACATSAAQTFTTLAYFDGSYEFSALIQGRDGNLYGTDAPGGAYGYGSIFQLTPAGTLNYLHDFCHQTGCSDGGYSGIPLLLASDGNFYGAASGGTYNMGIIFKLTPEGTYTVLHSFDGSDGSYPGALMEASDGNLYGATYSGPNGAGTVFRISPQGQVSTLHKFNVTDGISPGAPLIQGTDGYLYGTTHAGGIGTCYTSSLPQGCGTVFKISASGAFTVLHRFYYGDGTVPYAPVMQASNGDFYGTTFEGGFISFYGCPYGCGTIYRTTSSGTFTVMHTFDFGLGGNPYAGLVQANDGNLYGTSPIGGDGGYGEIFKMTPAGGFSVVYGFDPSLTQGGGATAVLQATDGKFYGTYLFGYYIGAAFSLDVGLGPFVTFVQPTGKTGGTAQILGQGFTGTTSVTFNGTPASFKVVSDTYLTATVPSGARSGPVAVTTPTGTLDSNVSFRITQ